jgi:hypothetical protein
MNTVVARVVGALEDEAKSKGHHPGLGDLIIAGTARAYGLTVITDNLRHFEPLNVAPRSPGRPPAGVINVGDCMRTPGHFT